MDLFLMRHGEAESYAAQDRDRALTDAGTDHVKRMALNYHSQLADISLIAVSPYRRALQTSHIILDSLGPQLRPDVLQLDKLTPNARPEELLQWLSSINHETVLLVTHQPLIGIMVERLCGLIPGQVYIPTAALAYIKLDLVAWGLGDLQWLKTS